MIVNAGAISLTPGSEIVTGTGTDFTKLAPGSFLTVPSLKDAWQIAKITDATHLTLTAIPIAAGGAASANVAYAVATDFTLNLSLPIASPYNRNPAALFTRALRLIDAALPAS